MSSGSVAAHRVALAGSYSNGNFGDDLMAVLFGLHLKRIGVPFSVYRLCAPYAERFGFRVAHSARDLLEGADTLVWGGGGLLVSWSRLTHRTLFGGMGRDKALLVEEARRRNLRLLAFSVGGSGKRPRRLAPRFKQSFLEAAEYISVRNPADLAIPQRFGVPADYYPDIIWRVSEAFPAVRRPAGRLRIGLDIYWSNLLRQNAAYLVPLLGAIMRRRGDCDFILLDTTNRAVRPYRGLGLVLRGPNVEPYQFSDPFQDTALFASLDLLVSTRLHAPMIALQYGVPAISVFGEGKTSLALETLSLDRLAFRHRRMGEFFSLMTGAGRLERFLAGYEFPDTAALAAASYGHLAQLSRLLGRAGPGTLE